MYVTPRARGRGVGQALVRAVLEEARRRGAPEVVLEVSSRNSAARALYEGCGFVATGAMHPHPRNGELHEIEMVATL